MNLRKRLERLETKMVSPENFEGVWDRMRARTRLHLRRFLEPEEAAKIERSPECQALLAEDNDELRRADQDLWDTWAKANKITNLVAVDGEIFEPIAGRILRWEAEDSEREERQSAGIKKAIASLDRGLGVEHQHVEAWIVSLNSRTLSSR